MSATVPMIVFFILLQLRRTIFMISFDLSTNMVTVIEFIICSALIMIIPYALCAFVAHMLRRCKRII